MFHVESGRMMEVVKGAIFNMSHVSSVLQSSPIPVAPEGEHKKGRRISPSIFPHPISPSCTVVKGQTAHQALFGAKGCSCFRLPVETVDFLFLQHFPRPQWHFQQDTRDA